MDFWFWGEDVRYLLSYLSSASVLLLRRWLAGMERVLDLFEGWVVDELGGWDDL